MTGNHRAGFASIFGRPNAGKSTLVNALVGEKIAAVSGLPQTTRDRIHGILSKPDFQIVFVDLPGLVEASDKLNEALRASAIDGLDGVDVVVHLVDATMPDPVGADMAAVVAAVRTPKIFAASKTDKMPADFDARRFAESLAPLVDPSRYSDFIAVSAQTGAGLPQLVQAVVRRLPEGEPLFDPENLTDRDMRFLASELIREKVFHLTHEEIPYATAVAIDEFQERARGKWYVAASIHVERDSQKGVVIGKGGAMLKRISQAARADIERLTGAPIFLELHVKVTPNWRRNDARLREFGYGREKKRRR